MKKLFSILSTLLLAIPFLSAQNAVDLGLSVLWADCNVGASSSEQFGGYYGWADPSGKNTAFSGVIDGNGNWASRLYGGTNPPKNICETKLDIATNKLGAGWRLPTRAEFEELANKCVWTYTTQNNVAGVLVTGPNGNSIFFPLAGVRQGQKITNKSEVSMLWTGEFCNESFSNWSAWCFCIKSSSPYYILGGSQVRAMGLSVRAVKTK